MKVPRAILRGRLCEEERKTLLLPVTAENLLDQLREKRMLREAWFMGSYTVRIRSSWSLSGFPSLNPNTYWEQNKHGMAEEEAGV